MMKTLLSHLVQPGLGAIAGALARHYAPAVLAFLKAKLKAKLG